jgi:hypothetical protein
MAWGAPYEKVRWRQKTWDYRTKAAVMEAEKRLKKTVMIYQGSYNGGVSASGGTHDGGGAIDCWVYNVDPNTVTRVFRNIGWADWWRKASQGPWNDHQHGILRGHKTASISAKDQVTGPNGYDNGGDGLANTVGDAQPYRPKPPVEFAYAAWVKERELATKQRKVSRKITETRRDLRHLVSIKRRLVERRKQLS